MVILRQCNEILSGKIRQKSRGLGYRYEMMYIGLPNFHRRTEICIKLTNFDTEIVSQFEFINESLPFFPKQDWS